MGVITLQHQHNSAHYQQEVVVQVDISSQKLDADRIKHLRFQDLTHELLEFECDAVSLRFYGIKNTKLYTGEPQSEALVARELILNTAQTDSQVALTICREIEGEIPGIQLARDRAKRLLVDARMNLLEHFGHVATGECKGYEAFEADNEYIQNLQNIADVTQDDLEYIQGVHLALVLGDIESEARFGDVDYSPGPTAAIDRHGYFPSLYDEVNTSLAHLNLGGFTSSTVIANPAVTQDPTLSVPKVHSLGLAALVDATVQQSASLVHKVQATLKAFDLEEPPVRPERTKKKAGGMAPTLAFGTCLIKEDVSPTLAVKID